MYMLLRSLPLRRLMIEQLPVFLAAFLIAEFFYKFHSFALECLAFVATWFVLDLISQLLYNWLWPKRFGIEAQEQSQ